MTLEKERSVQRRTVLQGIGLAGLGILAGCTTTSNQSSEENTVSQLDLWLETREGQREVMLVGTYHFGGSEGDLYTYEGDVLTEEAQSQLDSLTDRFVDWDADAIAVEKPPAEQDAVDQAYRAWRNDDLDDVPDNIGAENEVVQFAARLGEKLGHDQLHAVDHRQSLLAQIPEDRRREIPPQSELFPSPDEVSYPVPDPQEAVEEKRQKLQELTQTEYFRYLNQPRQRRMNDKLLSAVAMEESGIGDYLLADILTAWYQRNIRITANLWNQVDSDDEKILLLYGVSHVPSLRQLLNQAPMFSPVSPLPYLDSD